MPPFWRALIIQFLSEMTDRNFEVILFLAAWGPLWGMRAHSEAAEYCLVILGTSVAFIIRTLIIYFVGDSEWTQGYGLGASTVVAPLFLWFLVYKAWSHWKNEDALKFTLEAREKVIADDIVDAERQVDDANREGKEKVANIGFDKPRDQINWEQMREPKAMAFLIPFVSTLFVSISDPLQGATLTPTTSWDIPFALIMASSLSACVAVGAGVLLAKRINERRYLLCAAVTMFMSALGATSHMVMFFAYKDSTSASPVMQAAHELFA